MPQEMADLDRLINELGSVRSASFAFYASAAVRAAIDQAIEEATVAVVDTLNAPFDPPRLARAGNAIEVAREVVEALSEEAARSRRARERAAELTGRARELVERAGRLQPGR